MDFVIHRVNTLAVLRTVQPWQGVEVDVRTDGREIVLNHEPFEGGERLEDFLSHYHHGILVLNMKEAGIENETLSMVRRMNVKRFFLLDVEFPYIYRATRQGERAIAIRYSEDESIETVLKYRSRLDWVWIDVNTRLPLTAPIAQQLAPFKTCLVCPERWGRPEDIETYAIRMRELGFWPDAVMTSSACCELWQRMADGAETKLNSTPRTPTAR